MGGGGSPPPPTLPTVGTTTTTTVPIVQWRTIWEDQFNGTEVDAALWEVEHSTFGDGNNELQCYEPANASIADGSLTLEARRQIVTCPNGSTRAYSSGLLRSRQAWAYGAVEVRAKAPPGAGFMPAVWLLPTSYPYGKEGRSGEIDVMEVVTSDPSAARVTAHWNHKGDCGWGCQRYGQRVVVSGADTTSAFHTYRLEWEPGRLAWLIDGDPVYELGERGSAKWASAAANPAPNSATYPAPFDAKNPMYLLVNLAVGGKTPGSPTAQTPFPARFEIDWIRVQRPA